MFTGIIEAQGVLTAIAVEGPRPGIRSMTISSTCLQGLGVGASLAVDGVCLTATAVEGHDVTVEVMEETWKRSTLGSVGVGEPVNVELGLRADARLDGHFLQGHVDGIGVVSATTERDGWRQMRVQVPVSLAPFLAEKGSIALDGVSLTLTAVSPWDASEPWCEVGLIPQTLISTGLGSKREGARVNIETDMFAKYTQRILDFAHSPARSPGGCPSDRRHR